MLTHDHTNSQPTSPAATQKATPTETHPETVQTTPETGTLAGTSPQTQFQPSASPPTPITTAPPSQAKALPQNFAELADLFRQNRKMIHYDTLFRHGKLVDFQQGHVRLNLSKDNDGKAEEAKSLGAMAQLLKQWTGIDWVLEHVEQQGVDTLKQQQAKQQTALREEAGQLAPVQQILQNFLGQKLSMPKRRRRKNNNLL